MGKSLHDCIKVVVYFKYFDPIEILRDLQVETATLKWNIVICGDGTKSNFVKSTQKYLVVFQQVLAE